jgi:hypothetical protein
MRENFFIGDNGASGSLPCGKAHAGAKTFRPGYGLKQFTGRERRNAKNLITESTSSVLSTVTNRSTGPTPT